MIAQPRQRMSAEAFEDYMLLPENQERRLELIGGDIFEVVSNNYSSIVAGILLAEIYTFSKTGKLGWVTGADGGYVIGEERYVPDVAFVSRARQPEPSHEAYNPNPPDLAVEVLSPSDDESKLRIKVVNYLHVGTTVWVVNPEKKWVEVFVPQQTPVVLDVKDTLDGGQALPGFKLPVKDIFPD